MATNTNNGFRIGSVRDRVQTHNSKSDTYSKVDTNTGKVIDTKQGEPFKGVAQDVDGRRN